MADNEAVHQQLCSLTNEKAELLNANHALNRKLQAAAAELEALKAEQARGIGPQKLKAMFGRGRAQEQPAKGSADDVMAENEELQQQIAAQQTAMKELHATTRELAAQNTSLKELLAKSSLGEHDKMLELQREVEALRASKAAAPPAALEEVVALQAQLQESQQRLHQVKEKAKAAVQKLRDDFDAAQLRVQHLEAELQQRAAPAPEGAAADLAAGRVAELEAALEALRRECDALRSEARRDVELEELRQQLVQLQQEKADGEQRLHQVKEKAKLAVQRLRDDLDAATARVRQLEAEAAAGPEADAAATPGNSVASPVEPTVEGVAGLSNAVEPSHLTVDSDEAERLREALQAAEAALQALRDENRTLREEVEAKAFFEEEEGPEDGEGEAACEAEAGEVERPMSAGEAPPREALLTPLEDVIPEQSSALPSTASPQQGAMSDVAGAKAQLEAQVAELTAELERARASAEEERERSSEAARELQGRLEALEALEAQVAAKEEEARQAAEAKGANTDDGDPGLAQECQRLMQKLGALQRERSREADQRQALEAQLRAVKEEGRAKEVVIQQLLKREAGADPQGGGGWFASFGQKGKMDVVQRQVHKLLEDATQRNVQLEEELDRLQAELGRLEAENRRLHGAS